MNKLYKKFFKTLLFVSITTLISCACIAAPDASFQPQITTKTHTQAIIIETTSEEEKIIEATETAATTEYTDYGGTLTAHFLDVGQGDSIFIELPDGKNMLIDAGESGKSEFIKNYIKKIGYNKIDFLIATHPHSDHIGGIPDIIKSFEIGCFYLSPVPHTTNIFEKMLDSAVKYKINTKTIQKGDIICENEALNFKIEIIAPNDFICENLNNASIVLLITFGKISFLLMGDAETEEETAIVNVPSCNVLKVGHHGSDSSSSDAFLRKVSPEIAIISCGKNNAYGHPSNNIIHRFQTLGIKVYRTDLNGTVVIFSDGNHVKASQLN